MSDVRHLAAVMAAGLVVATANAATPNDAGVGGVAEAYKCWLNAWSTAGHDVPCADRPSCARRHERHG